MNAHGRLMLTVIAGLAEFERERRGSGGDELDRRREVLKADRSAPFARIKVEHEPVGRGRAAIAGAAE